MNLHRSLLAAFAGFFVTFVGWLILTGAWNRLGPDYEETAFIAVWRIPQMVQRCIAGFLGGYVAALIAGRKKVLHGAMAAVPFAYMTYGMHTMTDLLSPLWATLLDPGVPALFTILGSWIESRFPLKS